jgi:hypothetical protein
LIAKWNNFWINELVTGIDNTDSDCWYRVKEYADAVNLGKKGCEPLTERFPEENNDVSTLSENNGSKRCAV